MTDVSPKLAAWIGREREARMIVTPAGEVLWTSAAARVLLDGDSPFRDRNGHLATTRWSTSERLLKFLTSAAGHVQYWVLDEPGPWVIWAQQIDGDGSGCIGLTIRGGSQAPEFTALAEAGRLTPAEARIVTMMLAGADAGRIAAELDISVETLRTHVKHAYRKLGVTSRGELFAWAQPFLQP